MSGLETERLSMLSDEFPRESVSWRAQSVTKQGDKAMALAYIDARDVMDRLDLVCGPENWQDSYQETAKGRLICTLSINIGGDWISKSDGAGNTDVEGDKGAISDALKRAAVKWGVGRYLYDMPSPWVPCECYPEKRNDKWIWKSWKGSPWDCVRTPAAEPSNGREVILTLAQSAGVPLTTILDSYSAKNLTELSPAQADAVVKRLNLTIKDKQQEAA